MGYKEQMNPMLHPVVGTHFGKDRTGSATGSAMYKPRVDLQAIITQNFLREIEGTARPSIEFAPMPRQNALGFDVSRIGNVAQMLNRNRRIGVEGRTGQVDLYRQLLAQFGGLGLSGVLAAGQQREMAARRGLRKAKAKEEQEAWKREFAKSMFGPP